MKNWMRGGFALFLVCCLWFSVQKWDQVKVLKVQHKLMVKDNDHLNDQIKALSVLPDSQTLPFDQGAALLFQDLRMFEEASSIRQSFEISKAALGSKIQQDIQPSSWRGIGKIEFKLDFYDLKGVDERLKVLSFIQGLEQRYPVRLNKLRLGASDMEVHFCLYGPANLRI